MGVLGKALVQKAFADSGKGKKIPDSIKGFNMHQLLRKESSSGSGSGSDSGVDFGQSLDLLP